MPDLFTRGSMDRPWVKPKRGYAGDAGYDLFAAHDAVLNAGATVNIDVNTRVDFPVGWFGLIAERSSQGAKGFSTLGNVIDETYTGIISVNLHNASGYPIIVYQGDKVGQLLFVPRFIDPEEAKLPLRGDRGFGSSGHR